MRLILITIVITYLLIGIIQFQFLKYNLKKELKKELGEIDWEIKKIAIAFPSKIYFILTLPYKTLFGVEPSFGDDNDDN